MNDQTRYQMPVYLRIILVIIVFAAALLTALGVVPFAKFIGVPLSKLQGAGFEPTIRTLFITFLYAGSQFFLIWLVMRFIHKKPFSSLGFQGPVIKHLLWGTAIGVSIKAIEIIIMILAGSKAELSSNIPDGASLISVIGFSALFFIILLTLNSLKEELVFRAYPIELFNDYPGMAIPVIIGVSLLFAGIHHILEPFTITAFLSRFLVALLFSYVYYKSRSIWLVSGIHNGLNLLSFLLGANWKSGGLLRLSLDYPPEAVQIAADVFINAAAIYGFYFYWKMKKHIK